jgi:hypothetical protein
MPWRKRKTVTKVAMRSTNSAANGDPRSPSSRAKSGSYGQAELRHVVRPISLGPSTCYSDSRPHPVVTDRRRNVRTTPHSLPTLPTVPTLYIDLTIFPLRQNGKTTTQPIRRRTHALHTHPTKPRGSSSDLLNVAFKSHEQPHVKQGL